MGSYMFGMLLFGSGAWTIRPRQFYLQKEQNKACAAGRLTPNIYCNYDNINNNKIMTIIRQPPIGGEPGVRDLGKLP